MGKASILLVLGYSVILLVIGFNLQDFGTRSVENYIDYYEQSAAHNIALCGANLAANQLFIDPSWREGYDVTPFAQGTFTVTVDTLPEGLLKVTSIGKYYELKKTITFVLQPSTFAKFAYFTNIEGAIWWVSKDTVWGPFHTNSKMRIYGSPVFYGKVTTRLGIYGQRYRRYRRYNRAKFYGGYESGVKVDLPNDLSKLIAAANGGRKFEKTDVWLTFNADETVSWKTSATGPETTEKLTSFAPNGVILAEKGNMHIKGTVNGKVTVSATGSSGLGLGNVYVDDDIVYAQDPRTEPSDDMLGIAVDNNVIITENPQNNNDVRVQATIFCRSGGFTAEKYNTRPPSGIIDLLGGLIMDQRGPVGTFSRRGIRSGFSKRYRYDDRFMVTAPPFFPTTGKYEILSWLE
ncbi:MAG: hypothetical protein ACE5H0_03465 [Bacteroidota bacterium]